MDRNNFSDLYSASQKDLYKYCRSLCGNDADAQDLMQQTYLKALKSLEKLNDENLPAWLRSVARNIFLDNLRKSRYSAEELTEISDNSNNPEFIAEKRDIGRILLKALKDCLSPVQRMTVILYYYDEKSVSEIARIMQCSVGTVESRLYYARKKLRGELKKFGNIFTYFSLGFAVMKHRLKNIHIPVNARITVSAVMTAAAMVSVSMASIPNENKFPDTVITINKSDTSESKTTEENKTDKQTSTERASIGRISHATTNKVYSTMPTDESHTTAFKSKYEEIIETETEEPTEPTTKGSDSLQENKSEEETINETEEVTTMKKEIITVATAATMAVSGITATITTAVDETENITEFLSTETSAETSTETATTTEIEITTDLDKGVSKVTVFIRQKPDKTIYSIGEELDLTGGQYDVYEVVSFDYGGQMYSDGLYNKMTDGSKRTDGFSPIYTDIDTSEFDSTKAGTYRIYITSTNLNTLDSYTQFFEVTVTDDSEIQGTETDSHISGDANSDFKVSISDAVKILQNLSNKEKYPLTEQETTNADCYDPGSGVTGMDAQAVQKLDAGIIDSLPETLPET